MFGKRLTFFDVQRNVEGRFCVTNGSYSVVIHDLEIVGMRIKQHLNFEQKLRDNPMPTKTISGEKGYK